MAFIARLVATANTAQSATGAYATIRQSTAATATPGTTMGLGQQDALGTLSVRQIFLTFNTSAVPTGQTQAWLTLENTVGANSTIDLIEVRIASSGANMVAGDSLAALTLVGTGSPRTTGAGKITIPIDMTLVPRSASVILLVHSQNQRLAVQPPSNDSAGQVASLSHATTGMRPALDFGWVWIGTSTSVTVASTTHTLNEAANAKEGDLLVAFISVKTSAATSITLPAGWTRIQERTASSTLTTSSALAGAVMAYIIRGATAPSFTFTHPAGIDIAMGHVQCFRGVDKVNPLDVSAVAATATATTACSWAGITTTQADDLLVSGIGGGQEAAYTSYGTTLPAGDTSGVAQTTPVSGTGWTNYAANITTTGSDTSIYMQAAVMPTAAATGNAVATASISASHTHIIAAFRLARPSIPDAWDYNDQSGSITLSNSDKTATATAGTSAIQSTKTNANQTAGKFYAELKLGSAGNIQVGLQDVTQAGTSGTNQLVYDVSSGDVYGPGLLGNLGAGATNDVISFAIDTGSELLWVRRNSGNWNNSGTANPATGTGGWNYSSYLGAMNLALLFYCGSGSSEICTIRTEAAEFTQTTPDGFLSWMGETLPTADAWNVNDKTASVTLSNSDKTATAGATVQFVRSTQKRTSASAGKYYAEFKPNTIASSVTMGIKSGAATISTSTDSVRVQSSAGDILLNSAGTGSSIGGVITTSDVLCMAWDAGAERIWFRKNSGLWNNDASADPATGTNGADVSALSDVDFCLWTTLPNISDSVTLRTEAAEYTQPPPSGFLSWMGETLTQPNVTVAVTGVSATGSAGTVTVSTQQKIDVTGQQATGSAGTVTAIGKANVSLTGVSATGSAGTVTVIVPAPPVYSRQYGIGSVLGGGYVSESGTRQYATPAGFVADTSLGTASGNVTVSVTGVQAVGSAGTVTVVVDIDVTATVTGQSATGSAGTVTVSGKANVIPLGLEAGGNVGTVTVLAKQNVSTTVTGQQATGSAGSVTVVVTATGTATPAGVSATGQVGTVTAKGSATVTVSGQQAQGEIGFLTVDADVNVSVTGQSATGQVGTVTVSAVQNVSTTVSGQQAVGSVGGVSVLAGGSVSTVVTGQQAVGSAGTVTVLAVRNVTVIPSGRQATVSAGTVTIWQPDLPEAWSHTSVTYGVPTYSNGDKTVSGNGIYVGSTTEHDSGKWYVEVSSTTYTASGIMRSPLDDFGTSTGMQVWNDGYVQLSLEGEGDPNWYYFMGVMPFVDSLLGWAVDLDANKAWVRYDGGPWNTSDRDQTSWDLEGTFRCTMSNGDKTAAPYQTNSYSRSNKWNRDSKVYGEVVLAGTGTFPATGWVGAADDHYDQGARIFGNGDVKTYVGAYTLTVNTFTGIFPALTVNDIIGIAYDGIAGKVWFRVNNGNWNNNASYSPVTGVGGFIVDPGQLLPIAFGSPTITTMSMSLVTTPTFNHTVPSGYVGWSDSVPPDPFLGHDGFPLPADVNYLVWTELQSNDATIDTGFDGTFAYTKPVGFEPWYGPPETEVFVSGLSMGVSVGDVTASGTSATFVPVTGVQAVGSAGTVSVVGKANVSVTGQQAVGSAGTVTVSGKANVSVTGQQATGSVGTVTAKGSAVTTVTGVQATGFVGNVTVKLNASIVADGQQIAVQVGAVFISVTNEPGPDKPEREGLMLIMTRWMGN